MPGRGPLLGLFLGDVTADEVRATATMQAINKDPVRRKCEAAFFLAEHDLLHRRRDEAVTLMQDGQKLFVRRFRAQCRPG
jgi:hypothetical protein